MITEGEERTGKIQIMPGSPFSLIYSQHELDKVYKPTIRILMMMREFFTSPL